MRNPIERMPVQIVSWHVARYGPWLAVVAMAVISLVLTACGGGNGGGSSY